MFVNKIKTVFLLGTLSALLLLMGHWIGGSNGLIIALFIAGGMNFFTFFFSDKLVLKMYGAQPLDATEHGKIYEMVEELSRNARIPMPKLWYIPTPMANAFATGRNPKNASVAVTDGILRILDDNELRGVLAHELSHVKNRDILVATMAATIATSIAYLADMLRWSMIFGSSRDRREGGGGWGLLVSIMLIPFIATLIQLAISRSREYLADETGADISHEPLALASALEKLSGSAKQQHQEASYAEAATANLFIVNPFTAGNMLNWLSTHPPVEKRVKKLRQMAGMPH